MYEYSGVAGVLWQTLAMIVLRCCLIVVSDSFVPRRFILLVFSSSCARLFGWLVERSRGVESRISVSASITRE
jgi:hypothetical protein